MRLRRRKSGSATDPAGPADVFVDDQVKAVILPALQATMFYWTLRGGRVPRRLTRDLTIDFQQILHERPAPPDWDPEWEPV